MLRPLLLVMVLLGGAGLGCGLRQFPLVPDGGIERERHGRSRRLRRPGWHRHRHRWRSPDRRERRRPGLRRGQRMRASQPVSPRSDDLLGRRGDLHRHAAAPGQRDRLRDGPGLQQRRLRDVHSRRQLFSVGPALPRGSNLLRHGRARLHRGRGPAERQVVRQRDGLSVRSMCDLSRRRRLRAGDRLSPGDARLLDGHAGL